MCWCEGGCEDGLKVCEVGGSSHTFFKVWRDVQRDVRVEKLIVEREGSTLEREHRALMMVEMICM